MSGITWDVKTLHYYHDADPTFRQGCRVVKSCILTKSAWDSIATVLHPKQLSRLMMILTIDFEKKTLQ